MVAFRGRIRRVDLLMGERSAQTTVEVIVPGLLPVEVMHSYFEGCEVEFTVERIPRDDLRQTVEEVTPESPSVPPE